MEDRHKCTSILLLTQEHCGFCEQAQDILDRLSKEYCFGSTASPH